jgi:hypothetical protein
VICDDAIRCPNMDSYIQNLVLRKKIVKFDCLYDHQVALYKKVNAMLCALDKCYSKIILRFQKKSRQSQSPGSSGHINMMYLINFFSIFRH